MMIHQTCVGSVAGERVQAAVQQKAVQAIPLEAGAIACGDVRRRSLASLLCPRCAGPKRLAQRLCGDCMSELRQYSLATAEKLADPRRIPRARTYIAAIAFLGGRAFHVPEQLSGSR